jgi:hypothetical protein
MGGRNDVIFKHGIYGRRFAAYTTQLCLMYHQIMMGLGASFVSVLILYPSIHAYTPLSPSSFFFFLFFSFFFFLRSNAI